MAAVALTSLREAFGGRLLNDDEEMAPFLVDYRCIWHGKAIGVAQPDTAADVASILRWCSEHGVPVVAQGGNTGLSGGSVPDSSGKALLVSLRRLNRIRQVDAVNNTLIAEAGCTLQEVQGAARGADRLYPLSLAAQGSCTIGGTLSTNAGGVHVLRYGNARDLCLGLEVATPQGELWDGLRCLRKDNTGYSLRDLYIGAEGTLGIITAAVLKLFPPSTTQTVAFVAVRSTETAIELLSLAQKQLGAGLTAFELISESCVAIVLRRISGIRRPMIEASPWYVLLELSDSRDEVQAGLRLEGLLQTAMERRIVDDGILASSLAQCSALWALRESISDAQAAEGRTIKHDISLPVSRIPEFIATTDAAIQEAFPGLRMMAFGHLGDGNMHYNISPAADYSGPPDAALGEIEAPLNRLVHDAVVARGGSISAEHGLGVLRRDEAARYKQPVEVRLMRAVKTALDPKNIMNPGKLLAVEKNL